MWRLSAAALLFLSACSGAGDDWPDYDGPAADHYSSLDQINVSNAGNLGLEWHFDIDVGGQSLTAPVALDGVVYLAAGASHVFALDAKSGAKLWEYESNARELAGIMLRGAWGSRGIAYAGGAVYTGTLDGRLIALDAKSGKELWSVQTTEPGDQRYITGAPWVYKDKVVIGHGGADYAPVRGYVTAYDQRTGKQAWRFFTTPGDPKKGFEDEAMAMAAKTWTGDWWKFGGGATVWNAMAYDPKYNLLYIGTGNGSPWNQKIRSPGGGDNLFVCSIVALDADTGKYMWHYQVNPGESWDFNADMDIELVDGMEVNGAKHDVLMNAPKNGFYYVIDRKDGKLLSARPFMAMNWASGIDMKTGRPIEYPQARYPDGKPFMMFPTPFGAHNIEAMSYNPGTGLTYIPAMDRGWVYVDAPEPLEKWTYKDGQRISNGTGSPPADIKPRPASSVLIAWDPKVQKEVWRIPMFGPRGGGGTATTGGGLLLQGRGTGEFTVLDAKSGKMLWSFPALTAVMAQPITYRVGGKQYITVVAGSRFPTAQGLPQGEWNYRTQQWRVLTFALGGKDHLPPAPVTDRTIPDNPALRVDPAQAKLGAATYAEYCGGCHGANAMSGGSAPDLLRSPIPLDLAGFTQVVKTGPLVSRGMPKFDEIPDGTVKAIGHFLRQRAREVAASQKPVKVVEGKGQ